MTHDSESSKTSRRGWVKVLQALAGIALAGVLAGVLVAHWRQTAVPRQGGRTLAAEMQGEGYPPAAYREVGQVATGLRQARGIALDGSGNLYVAGDQTVLRFNPAGERHAAFPLSAVPYCLALAGDGTLFVGMRDHVEVYDRRGRLTAQWASLGARARLTALAVAPGEVWAADAGNRVVWRLEHTGTVRGQLGKRDAARRIPGLVVPSPHLDVAVGADGRLRIANPGRHRVETYTPAGDLTESWGEFSMQYAGFSGCCNPTDIALFPDGRVVTSEKGIPRIKVYRADGTFESLVASPRDLSPGVVGLDLAVDAGGRILVLDPQISAVRIFARAHESNE